MSEAKAIKHLYPVEDYLPQQTPRSLQVILGKGTNKKSGNHFFIKELDEIRIVGFRVLCDGDQYQEEIPKAAKLLHERTDEIKHVLNSGKQVGAFIVGEAIPEKDGYWVGVQVSKYDDVPKGMVPLTIPEQKYAATLHHGPNHLIRKSHESLHKWMAKKGFKSAIDCWNLEFYQKVDNIENIPENLEVVLYNSIY